MERKVAKNVLREAAESGKSNFEVRCERLRNLLVALIILPSISFGHQDREYESHFDNVHVRFTTGHRYEEINKSKIIGEYCSYLADSLNYSGEILLDFIHDYTNAQDEADFISFDDGSYKITIDGVSNMAKTQSSVDRIVLRQIVRSIDFKAVLTQLEFAIQNLNLLNQQQKERLHPGYFLNMFYTWKSLPASTIDSISQSNQSNLVETILSQRIFRPEEKASSKYHFSYFVQNDDYVIFRKAGGKIEPIDTLSLIFEFKRPDSLSCFVLGSYSDFRVFYDSQEKVFKSSKHTIPKITEEYYSGITVECLDAKHFLIKHYDVLPTHSETEYNLKDDSIVFLGEESNNTKQ